MVISIVSYKFLVIHFLSKWILYKMGFNLDTTYGYNNDIHKSKIIKHKPNNLATMNTINTNIKSFLICEAGSPFGEAVSRILSGVWSLITISIGFRLKSIPISFILISLRALLSILILLLNSSKVRISFFI